MARNISKGSTTQSDWFITVLAHIFHAILQSVAQPHIRHIRQNETWCCLWLFQWWEWWRSVRVQLTHRDKACKHLEHKIVIIPDVSPGYNSLDTCVYVLIGTEKAVSLEYYWLGVKQGVQSASSQAFWHVFLTIRLKDFFCLSLFVSNIGLGKLPDLLKHWPAVLHKCFDEDSWIVLLLLMSSDIIT